jgi:hypothetical protein
MFPLCHRSRCKNHGRKGRSPQDEEEGGEEGEGVEGDEGEEGDEETVGANRHKGHNRKHHAANRKSNRNRC